MWTRTKLLRSIDVDRVRDAIGAAERKTSAEIRVAVSGFFWGSVHVAARAAFRRLSMTSTAARNGVLVFVAPARRRFLVIGDEGAHERLGQASWDRVAATIAEAFRSGEFTRGLTEGIRVLGEDLARAFPFDPRSDENELPDDVDLE